MLNQSQFAYDSNGNQTNKTTWRTVPGSAGVSPATETLVTTYIYNSENRLVETINPDGSTNATIYTPGLNKPAVVTHFFDIVKMAEMAS